MSTHVFHAGRVTVVLTYNGPTSYQWTMKNGKGQNMSSDEMTGHEMFEIDRQLYELGRTLGTQLRSADPNQWGKWNLWKIKKYWVNA